jgi:hypothetical protein
LNIVSFSYTQNNDPFTAVCFVAHTPMKWNYWHFSLQWNTDLGPLENFGEKKRKNVAKRIGQSVRVLISHFAMIEIPVHPPLQKNCYCKN